MPYKWIYLLYIRHIYYTIEKIFHRLSRVNFQNFGKMCYIFAITKLERFAIWFMQSPKTNINPISESDGIEIIANKKIERHIRWWHHDKPKDWAWLVPGALYNLFGIFCYDRLDSFFFKDDKYSYMIYHCISIWFGAEHKINSNTYACSMYNHYCIII